jgi:hypothetical protein
VRSLRCRAAKPGRYDTESDYRAQQLYLRVCPIRFASMTLFFRLAVGLATATFTGPLLAGAGVEELWRQTHWGESSEALRRQFGSDASTLPRALDFGDSYVDVVLPSQMVGAVPMVVFFQMDKVTHGLKRIQLERPRHGVNPPALRAVLATLQTDFGSPDRVCAVPVLPASGYQAAAEALWLRDDAVVSAIFRDTTLQAFAGCLFGPATGSCGLTGQLLVRIGPPSGDGDPCSLERHRNP